MNFTDKDLKKIYKALNVVLSFEILNNSKECTQTEKLMKDIASEIRVRNDHPELFESGI